MTLSPLPPASRLLLALAICAAVLLPGPAARAQPEAETLFRSVGRLAPAAEVELPIDAAAAANLRLSVVGGEGGEVVALAVRQSGGVAVDGALVKSGEASWNAFDLPQGGSLTLRNTSSASLGYELFAYAVDGPLTSFAGVSRGDGGPSTIRLRVARAGDYALALEVAEGQATLLVDEVPARADDVHLGGPEPLAATATLSVSLGAGMHTLTVRHDRELPRTAWRLTVTELPAPAPSGLVFLPLALR
jgi:hypothetical protein